jgi:hypothetical protein
MGKYFSAILCVLLLFAVSNVNASITSWNCGADGDGAIVMDYGSTTLTLVDPVTHDYDLTMSGDQYWLPAHLQGDFQTGGTDPTVRIIEDIGNDTSFAWTDYHITIGMTQSFSFVSSGLLAPAGWTAVVINPAPGILPNTNGVSGYVGTINYYQSAGDAIAIGDTGTFGLKVSFLGSTNFTTEQIPTPEPATLVLLGLGAVAAIRRKRA